MRDLTKEIVWCNLSDEVIARNLGCGWGRPFAALDNRHPHSVFYCLERRAKAPVFAAAVYLLYVCQCVPKLSGGCIRFPGVDLSQGPPGLQYLRRTKNHGQDGCKNRSNYDLGGFAEGSQAGLAVQLELCGDGRFQIDFDLAPGFYNSNYKNGTVYFDTAEAEIDLYSGVWEMESDTSGGTYFWINAEDGLFAGKSGFSSYQLERN